MAKQERMLKDSEGLLSKMVPGDAIFKYPIDWIPKKAFDPESVS